VTARAAALDTLRALTGDELAAHLREQRGQLFQVRLQQTIGQVENHRQIRAIRKEIARTMTVQVESRLAAERGQPAPAPRPAATASAGRRRAAVAEATVAPPRPRRARAAAAESTAPEATAPASTETDVVAADAPLEDVISDVEVERIEPDAADATAASDEEAT
jgi:large subunit ribosomal protein L29